MDKSKPKSKLKLNDEVSNVDKTTINKKPVKQPKLEDNPFNEFN